MCVYWIHEPDLMLSQLRMDTNQPNSTKRTNVLNVYFGYMRYTQTEAAQVMMFDTFISNLGGAIGLWTGMSLISIVQMLVYSWEGFWRMVERRRAEKMIRTMLAQHLAQSISTVAEKPIRIQGALFVKLKVQFGPPQPAGQKNGSSKRVANMITSTNVNNGPSSTPNNGMGLVARLKTIFKRNRDVVRPTYNDAFGKSDDSPPDPKPRVAPADSASNPSTRNQSLGTLFEPPPVTVDNVGAAAPSPWATIIEEKDKSKKEKVLQDEKIGYSNPGSPISHSHKVR